jgi:hypothetical protein
LTEGRAYARLEEGQRLELPAGISIIFPHGDAHRMGNGLTDKPVDGLPGPLRSTEDGVAEVAGAVGYGSEAAFNRAFKREYDCPPAQFRRDYKSAPRRRERGPPEWLRQIPAYQA